MRILIVEDEAELATLLAARLGAAGFVVDCLGDCADAFEAVLGAPYGLVLLDRRLPDGDGAALIPRLRTARPGLAVILLTALDQVAERVGGLDAGADDYLVKPFDMDELLARIRAALRRPGAAPSPPILCGQLSFDPAMRAVSVAGEALHLRRRELAILEVLIQRAGRVVPRERLLDAAFGCDDDITPASVETHISRLRRRLEASDAGVAIHAIRGVGYVVSTK